MPPALPTLALPFLGDADLARMYAAGTETKAPRGQVLITEDELPSAILFILEGEIAIERDGVTIAHLGPGEILGEISLLEDDTATATARVQQDARVVRISRTAVEALLASDPQLAGRFYRSLAVRLAVRMRRTNAQLSRLQSSMTRERDRSLGELPAGALPTALVAELAAIQTDAARLEQELLQQKPTGNAAAKVAALCDRVVALVDTYTDEAQILRTGWGELTGFGDLERLRTAVGFHLQRASHTLFMSSATVVRCTRRGGTGMVDYETARMIATPTPAGDGVLGQLVDTWFLARPLCRLRRAAATQIRTWLVDSAREAQLRVCAIGGGTFTEAFDAMKEAGRIHVTCLDADPTRIRHALAGALDGGLGERSRFLCADVIELARGGPETRIAAQHRIYSLESLETLDDDEALALLNFAHAHLEKNGVARFTTLAPELADRRWLKYLLGWPLRSRSAAALADLARRSHFDAPGTIEPIAGGAGLTLTLRRSTAAGHGAAR